MKKKYLAIVLFGVCLISSGFSNSKHFPKGRSSNASFVDLTPGDVVRDFYNSSLDGKIKEALAHTTGGTPGSTEGVIATGRSTGKSELERWVELIGEKRIEITSVNQECISGNKAFVVAETNDQKGNLKSMVYWLAKSENQWKVFGMVSFALVEQERLRCSEQ
jgi:hypothetical protein